MPTWRVVSTSRICVFCGGPITGRKGEHVLPQRLQRTLDLRGPFTLEVNGVPEMRRDGAVAWTNQSPRVMLRDVCGSDDPNNCNGWLDQKFEQPGMPFVEQVLGPDPVLDAYGVEQFARWMVKTLLLLAHPATHHLGYRSTQPRAWAAYPDRLLKDLRQTGLFPDCLSLWLAVYDPETGTGQLPAATRIVLDRTFYSDGSAGGGRGEATNIGFGTIDKRVIELQLAYHPLCIVRHPFEQGGLATRLWPNPPDQLDLRARPTLNATGLDQWKHVFLIGKSAFGVRPRHALELIAAPGTRADPMPMPKEVCLHP